MSEIAKNYKLQKKIPWQTLDGSVILLSPKAKRAHELDEIGSLIWRALDENLSTEDIVAKIIEDYDVDFSTANIDVSEFIKNLETKQLIEEA